MYKSFNLDLEEADAVWLPHYGKNNGKVSSRTKFPCDIHQYTDKERLNGYAGQLVLNRIISNKKLSYFTGETPVHSQINAGDSQLQTYKVLTKLSAHINAGDAKIFRNQKGIVKPGTYYI